MALKFHDVKVIEDAHELLDKKQVRITENHLFVGPVKIQDAETWEMRLAKQKTPYVLVQAETTIPVDDSKETSEIRFSKGYFIFVKEESDVAV